MTGLVSKVIAIPPLAGEAICWRKESFLRSIVVKAQDCFGKAGTNLYY
jgi:hypothetical protein